jgi:hypothetical protein
MTLLPSRAINRGMLPVRQASLPVASPPSRPLADEPPRRRLAEADAIDIWIARWLRIRRKDLVLRYGCDPRRLYEIWEEKRFPGSRAKAREKFDERHPGLADRVDFGLHRRIPRGVPPDLQPDLFDTQGSDRRIG